MDWRQLLSLSVDLAILLRQEEIRAPLCKPRLDSKRQEIASGEAVTQLRSI